MNFEKEIMKNLIEDAFKFPILNVLTTIDVEPLIKYSYELKNKNDGRSFSNINGWQSGDLDKNLKIFTELKKTIEIVSNNFHCYMNLKKTYIQTLDNFWININPTGGTNKPHSHPGSVFSGVIYLKTPENCGKINFINPCRTHEYHFNQDTVEEYNNYTWSGYYHTPQVGKLVMFPSSLEHYVDGNISNEDRISIAFNTKFKTKDI
jgi:uncharacterized protein (TIGR02466 family)